MFMRCTIWSFMLYIGGGIIKEMCAVNKQDLRMYILVNEDIKINKGKLAGQVGHAVNVYVYRIMNKCIRYMANGYKKYEDCTDSDILGILEHALLDDYMDGEIKKIILYAPQSKLEELESDGLVTIRDKGYTDLEPNTLTCVNLGILDYNDIGKGFEWVKDLKLVR